MWCSKLRELIDIHGKSWTNFSHIHLDRNLTASITALRGKSAKGFFGNMLLSQPSYVKACNLKFSNLVTYQKNLWNFLQRVSIGFVQPQPTWVRKKQPEPAGTTKSSRWRGKNLQKERKSYWCWCLGVRALPNSHFLQEPGLGIVETFKTILNRTENSGKNCPGS